MDEQRTELTSSTARPASPHNRPQKTTLHLQIPMTLFSYATTAATTSGITSSPSNIQGRINLELCCYLRPTPAAPPLSFHISRSDRTSFLGYLGAQRPGRHCCMFPNKSHIGAATTPARDRVVGFGKYRGKMLGTLPSSYLRWISKNLQARDFEEWSRLADEVLEDPVYRDRIEWEFAEEVLRGNRAARSSSSMLSSRAESAVSELLEISERFGWDNQDKAGWSSVNFELLGTSKGGKIPRTSSTCCGDIDGATSTSAAVKDLASALPGDDKRRRERRERVRLKKRSDTRITYKCRDTTAPYPPPVTDRLTFGGDNVKKQLFGRWNANASLTEPGGLGGGGDDDEEVEVPSSSLNDSGSDSCKNTAEEEVDNPFPGRAGLLKKVFHLNLATGDRW